MPSARRILQTMMVLSTIWLCPSQHAGKKYADWLHKTAPAFGSNADLHFTSNG